MGRGSNVVEVHSHCCWVNQYSPCWHDPEGCLACSLTLLWPWLLKIGKHCYLVPFPDFPSFTICMCACAFYNTDSFLSTVLTEPAQQGFCAQFYWNRVPLEIPVYCSSSKFGGVFPWADAEVPLERNFQEKHGVSIVQKRGQEASPSLSTPEGTRIS